MISNIEDLILHICDPITGLDHSKVEPRDKGVLFSLASQLRKPLPFTERQANLALKILERNQDSYRSLDVFDLLIKNPIYKYSFRSIDTSKKISIIKTDSGEHISIKFPFDTKINNALASITKKTYDKNSKSYLMHLEESNIIRVLECLKEFDFEVDNTISRYHEKIQEIRQNPEAYVPCVDFREKLVFNNFPKSMADFLEVNLSGSFLHDLFLCKLMSVSFSKKLREMVEKSDIDPLSKGILLHNENRFHVKTVNNIDISKSLKDINHWPVLIIMPDDKESTNTISQWVFSLKNIGLDTKDISVLFRSQVEKSFNDFVRDNNLNNLVTSDTKVVFIKHKMPKILYRIGFSPRIIISLSTFYAHFTNQKMVDSHPLVLYYNNNQSGLGRSKIASL